MKKIFAVLMLALLSTSAFAGQPFIASVPEIALTVGQTMSVAVTLTGPEAVHIGLPGKTDLGMQVRINLPSCLTMVDVRPMQTYPPRSSFKWGNAGNKLFPGDHYILQEFTYLDAGTLTAPFDVQMGPFYVVTVKATATCSGPIDLKTVKIGQNTATSMVDGFVNVISAQ